MPERRQARPPFDLPLPRMLRLPGPLGCLLMVLLLPVLLIAGLGLFVWGLLGGGPARRSATSSVPRAPSDEETALCSLIRKMAMDASFTREDAEQAGVDATASRSVDEMLETAVGRGWLERVGDGYTVTARGREGAESYLRGLAL